MGLDPQKIFCENTASNMNVFEAAKQSGVKKIIFASSVQALAGQARREGPPSGLPPYLPLDGDAPANPGNPYALSKQVGEVLLAYFARYAQMDCVAVRFPCLLLPGFFAGGQLYDRSEEGFAFLHLEDAARLVLACLKASLPGFRVYFPASPQNGLLKPAREVIRDYYAGVPLRRPVEEIQSLVDISRIETETGWTPKFTAPF